MGKNRRRDIDVLRALAVIPVIIFHFKKELLPLGYLGVDIFFVISGYLIAKIILKNLKNNSFSFFDFYIRRIKRILPAFLFVIIISFIIGSMILLTGDIKNLSQSVISSIFFLPNFYFWITGGYFGTNDELKPLLHLWSLGVEIQFYILFPILFFVLYKIKLNSKKILIFIILITLVSLLLNILFIYKGHRDSLFFLFPFRFWEFGFGILTALVQNKNKDYIFFEKYRTLIGVLFIVSNYIFKFNFLPDALFICVGTSLLLFKENISKNLFSSIFNSNILIFFGLISYSLYLWHWPIASYLKYISVDELSIIYIFLGVSTTLVLSFYSWKYVEKPFLEKSNTSKFIFRYVFISYSLLISISFLIFSNKIFPNTHNDYLNKISGEIGSTYHCSFLNYLPYGDTYGCLMNGKSKKDYSVAIFGNSHAAMYGWGIKRKLIENNNQALLIHLNDCLPLIDANISKMCLRKTNKYYESIIKDAKIKKVIIGLTWYTQLSKDKNNKTLKESNFDYRNNSLIKLINKLTKNKKDVYLIGPLDLPEFDISSEIRKVTFGKEKKIKTTTEKDKFLKENLKSINLFSKKLGEKFLRPDKIFCNKNNCLLGDSKSFFFSDNNHLSKHGSLKTFKLFENINFN